MDWLHKGSDMPISAEDAARRTEQEKEYERQQQLRREEIDRQMKEEHEKFLLRQEELKKEAEREGKEFMERSGTFVPPTRARFTTPQIYCAAP